MPTTVPIYDISPVTKISKPKKAGFFKKRWVKEKKLSSPGLMRGQLGTLIFWIPSFNNNNNNNNNIMFLRDAFAKLNAPYNKGSKKKKKEKKKLSKLIRRSMLI